MATLFQMLTKSKKPVPEIPPAEFRFANPFKRRINDYLRLNLVDLAGSPFQVRGLMELQVHDGNGRTTAVPQYDLLARPVGHPEISRRLRLVPDDNPDGQITHKAILLELVMDFPYNAEYHEGLQYEKNQGEAAHPQTNQDGSPVVDCLGQPVFDTYYRVDDVQTPWEAALVSLRDEDGSGKVDENEIRHSRLVYWDFWRNAKDADGMEMREFYIIEMSENGRFQIWRGPLVDPARIETV